MENEKKLTAIEISGVTGAAQQLLEKIVTGLADAARVSIDRKDGETESRRTVNEPHLFFPNGIELISLVVRAGPVDCELTVAGEKGSLARTTTSGAEHMAPGIDTSVAVHQGGTGYRGHTVNWYHPMCHHASVTFTGPSPFEVGGFPVYTPPGTPLKVTTNQPGFYEYSWECQIASGTTEDGPTRGGTARIQIL